MKRHTCLGCGKKFFFKRNMYAHYEKCDLAKILNEGLRKVMKSVNDLFPSVQQATDALLELGEAMRKVKDISDEQR